MDYYCDLGVVNSETFLIGHSCGCAFLVKYLLTHKIKVKGLITVSGYNNFLSGDNMMNSLNESFYFDSTSSVDMSNYANTIIWYYENDDPYIPQEYLKKFVDFIGGKEVIVSNAGHFNASSGYTKFDLILEDLSKIQ